jgi:predicted transcriptional regulator
LDQFAAFCAHAGGPCRPYIDLGAAATTNQFRRNVPNRLVRVPTNGAAIDRDGWYLHIYDVRRSIPFMTSFLLPADELEYTVLAKLWELGAASVRELHEHLGQPAGRVYTTTAKVIDRLRSKRLIQRQRRGKAFVYRPRAARPEVESARAKQAVSRLLGATPRAAVAALVDAVDDFDPKLLDELERAVNARRRSKRGT